MRPIHRVLISIAAIFVVAGMPLPAYASSARIQPAFAERLEAADAGDVLGGFVHFAQSATYADGAAAVRDAGLSIGADLRAGHLLFAFGSADGFRAVAGASEVTFLEHGGTEPLLMETASWATRSRTLYEQTGGADVRVRDAEGDLLDGAGVGIAIVDSGIDGLHPDLTWHEKTVRNFKTVCTDPNLDDAGCLGGVVMEDVPDSDTSSGHGSHVAGIAAGDGTASDSDGNPDTTGDRMFRGVAPGAKLYGFGAGEGANILVPSAAAAFQWIFDNADNPCAPDPADPVACPPIRVVNNSWGGTGAHDPALAISKLGDALVGRGITVVFAAGNSGGDGTAISTNPYGNNDTEGVVSVANYYDNDTGSRDAAVDSTSSRGQADRPETWPDVAAPGTFITSTCRPHKPVCWNGATGVPSPAYPPNYTILAGTSMAAPHTSGVISLLYQADPGITPAEVEDVLEDNAHKFTAGAAYEADPANGDDTSSFDKGHGLVDARASALELLGLQAGQASGAAPVGTVSIDSPADGAKVKKSFVASGTAEVTGGSGGVSTTVLASGDGGDYAAVDSLDLAEVRLIEDAAADTVRVEWQTAGTTTLPPAGNSFNYVLDASMDGVPKFLGVRWNGTAVSLFDADTPAACTPSRDANVFALTCPATSIGATDGAVLFDAIAASIRVPNFVFTGFLLKGLGTEDIAPGGLSATGLSLPERGEEHVFGGGSAQAPSGEVTISIDGGVGNPVVEGSGAFSWATTVGPLSSGTHTVTASLFLDGASTPAATDTVTVTRGGA